MSSFISANRPLNSSLPAQQISLTEKLKNKDKFGVSEWMKMNMDGLESIGRFQYFNNLALRENYEIINGRFMLKHYLDSEDYFDLASAISQEFQLPNYLKHYDITSKAVNLLQGEFLKRPDIFRVVAVDSDSTNEKIRVQSDLMQTYLSQSIRREISQKLISQGIDPFRDKFQNEEEQSEYQAFIESKYQELTPESIHRYMKYDYRTGAEHWGQAVLTSDKERFSLRELEKIEFTDMLVADRCFTHFYLTATGYNMETWNPINTFFHYSPEVRYVEDGDYVGRTFYLSKAQIIDRYGWRMTKEQQEALYPAFDKDKVSQGAGYNTLFQTWVYPFQNYDDFYAVDRALGASVGFNPLDRNSLASIPLMDEFDNSSLGNSYAMLQNDLVQVTEAYWMSQRKLGHLLITNSETTEVESFIVDETFNPKLFGIKEVESSFKDHDEPDTIAWVWVKQPWQGIKINENHVTSSLDTQSGKKGLYIDIRPTDFSFKGDYNIFNSKLPVCGGIFNNRNGRSMAIVDLLKPYQIYYNALLNQAYGITQRNNGKFFLMDVNILPSLKDWGGEEAFEKFMGIANSLGIGLIDSSTANPNNKGNANFNHYQVIDLDETEKVTRLINLAMLVEMQGFLQLGITPQRQGQTQASETAQGNMIAVNNSYAITETYFENYYNYKKRRLKMHLDIAQYCASQEKDITLPYITSDLGEAFIKITGTELLLKDLGVNVTYSAETARQRQLAEQLILNNNTTDIPMSKLISMLRLESLADIQKILEQSEAEMWQRKQEEMQQLREIEEMKIQAAKEQDMANKTFEATENQLDRENDLRIAAIKTMNFDPDVADTGRVESLEAAKLGIEQSKLSATNAHNSQMLVNQQLESFRKANLEKDKLKAQKELQDKQHKIDKQQMEHSLKLEDKKIKSIEVQNKSQEKIAKEKHENDINLANKKLELEKLKLNNAKKIADTKIQEAKEKVKIQKDLNAIKKNEAKEISNDKVELSEKTTKIKLDVSKQLAKQKVKDAKKPK